MLNVVNAAVFNVVNSFHVRASNKDYRTEVIYKSVKRIGAMRPLHKNGALELFCVGDTVVLAHLKSTHKATKLLESLIQAKTTKCSQQQK